MIRTTLLAASALLIAAPAATPAFGQSAQEQIDERYDRALAAGYKALFLCSAIANAERIGSTRTPEEVESWELAGIQAPLDRIVGELEYRVFRANEGTGVLTRVEVDWDEAMPPRLALHQQAGGCALQPVGQADTSGANTLPYLDPRENFFMWHERIPKGGWKAIRERAFDGSYGSGTRTTALIVAGKSGPGTRFSYESDFGPTTPQRTWSVAKSIAATLIGAAVYRGEADVNASAGLGTGENDPRRAITIDNALRMASGRYSDTPGNRTDPLYYGGATIAESMTHWPLIAPPGTVFRYANNDTLAATQAIRHTFKDHSPAEFFKRVGMHDTVAETDWKGDYVLSSQVWSTARDFVTLGQLHLNDGVLPDGTRILPEGWVEYISTPSGPQPEGRGWGYGAGWWLFNQSEGIPSDTFFAAGNRGQYLVVVPSRNIVIVRRGEDPVGARFDIEAFTRDVLSALGE